MADPVLTLDSATVSVEPGGQARVTLTIFNPGSIVEGYRVEVLGEGPTQWAEVVPAEVSVYPQQEATAVVVFSPPSGSSAPGGTHAFGVRATSTVEPDSSAVVEGDLDIRKVFGLQAKIVPVTSSGRWRGRHVVQLSNWGNAPVRLRMAASDPDAALGFYLHPDVVDLPIGVGASVRVSVKTRKPFLRGTPVRLPFQIVGEQVDPASAPHGPVMVVPYGDPGRPVVDGAFSQRPILSRFVVSAAAFVVIAAVAIAVWALMQSPPTHQAVGDPLAPSQPALAAAPQGDGAITLSWKAVPNATGYKLITLGDGPSVFLDTVDVDGQQKQQDSWRLAAGHEALFPPCRGCEVTGITSFRACVCQDRERTANHTATNHRTAHHTATNHRTAHHTATNHRTAHHTATNLRTAHHTATNLRLSDG